MYKLNNKNYVCLLNMCQFVVVGQTDSVTFMFYHH